ncbi:hypothetical protein C0992_001422, partial [Termitomyces sp. T32_za158]
ESSPSCAHGLPADVIWKESAQAVDEKGSCGNRTIFSQPQFMAQGKSARAALQVKAKLPVWIGWVFGTFHYDSVAFEKGVGFMSGQCEVEVIIFNVNGEYRNVFPWVAEAYIIRLSQFAQALQGVKPCEQLSDEEPVIMVGGVSVVVNDGFQVRSSQR